MFLFPAREVLCLGDRVITYLPRCADTNSEVRKVSAQVFDESLSFHLSVTIVSNGFLLLFLLDS